MLPNIKLRVPIILWNCSRFDFSSVFFVVPMQTKKNKHASTKTFATATIFWEKGCIFWQNCKGADIFGRICIYRGGITILKFPHPHVHTQPWQRHSLVSAIVVAMVVYVRVDAEISKSWHKHIQTKSQHGYVVWNKAKSTILTYQEEITQPQRPIRAVPAPWVFSTAALIFTRVLPLAWL